MGMRVHELHPALIHAPLVLLPTAAVVDLLATTRKDPALARFGRGMWVAGTASGLMAGLAGMAASQEVDLARRESSDTVFLHGLVNVGIVVSALGVTLWRRDHAPGIGTALLGLVASGIGLYSAYLGGEAVYGQGVGIKALKEQPRGRAAPPLFSREAPRVLLQDAIRGLGWLLRRGRQLLSGKDTLELRAFAGATGMDEVPSSVLPNQQELLSREEIERPLS